MNVEFIVESVVESSVRVGDVVYDGFKTVFTSPSTDDTATLFTATQEYEPGQFVIASFEITVLAPQEHDSATTKPLDTPSLDAAPQK